QTEPLQAPKIIGLLFYADWCGSCKILEPKIDSIKKEFASKPILFTRVDMTDDFTKAQSRLFAHWVGLGEIYNENKGKTGFMLLIQPQDGKVLSKLVKTNTEEDIRAEIKKTLLN
ncbi:MAG: thioredoxin domain-containing protein, partial [bacterium]|nr:thioredoxin domain-containing protein [bacterium]